jgi:hypothetical protein
MKVGILTYHNTMNYGAALQTYATQEALRGMGMDAEIIDYTNEYRRGSYSFRKRFLKELRHGHALNALKTLTAMPMIINRTKNFAAFYQSNLWKSTSVYNSMQSIKENPPDYDVYLAGSDQIWSYRNNGADFNYMLDFVSDKSKTVSYASSFGVDKIPERLKENYAEHLNKIRAISVREKLGANLVNQLTGRKAEIVLDPVFLLEKNGWHEVVQEADIPKHPYMLVYTSKPEYFSKFQDRMSQFCNNLNIIQIGSAFLPSDLFRRNIRVRSSVRPEQFLGYIKNAEIILTSSFHGTAFSILMNKPFIVFLSGDKGRDARIVELLSRLNLSDRVFDIQMATDVFERGIDYTLVNEKISVSRKQSIGFLRNILEQISMEQSKS